ncbi:hypothetical protein C479_09333 [Halovivax asiaticus JCM 14624]|uniref:Uncharacterized protein n=1 Tax=Halovivax asiaticus JCM 14624 TaxID=1227490 RepID=M0BKM6_9EURY|nr:hypothetical protein [Halovivax asiaticus]ELZ11002.1 hypothetical protein C479_09333 [Halovivax asiaticus JCM 14624]
MGSRTEGDDGPIRRTDSLEALLQATDRDTEEIVEALRESGPRRHVSESSVDEVLETASRPQAADDDAFALSGGPTRTISTTGIDEVFETLESEAPPLSTASARDAASQSATEPDASTTANESESTSEPADAAGESTTPSLAEVDGQQHAEATTVASLSGGGPRRTVSEQSVDDILSLLDDEEPDTTDSDAAAADLRPDDAGDALASLLADAEPPTGSTEPSSECDEPERSQATDEASVSVEPSNTVDAAVSALETHAPGDGGDIAESNHGADDSRAEATDCSFEWGPHETGDEADVSDANPGPVTTEQPPTPDDAGALVTRAELEEIAALVSEPESTPTRPDSAEAATGHSASAEPRTVGPARSGEASGVTDEATGAPSSPSTVVVSVDTVLAPTAEQSGDRNSVVTDRRRRSASTESPASSATGERGTEERGREPANTSGPLRSLWRRLRKWVTRR